MRKSNGADPSTANGRKRCNMAKTKKRVHMIAPITAAIIGYMTGVYCCDVALSLQRRGEKGRYAGPIRKDSDTSKKSEK